MKNSDITSANNDNNKRFIFILIMIIVHNAKFLNKYLLS